MKTRVGKIARLPKIIRDQLNQQLEDGFSGHALLTWLNALPQVQKILAEQFGGHPVSKQNISEWRRGGYTDWSRSRDGRQHWWELMETAGKLTEARNPKAGVDTSRYLGTFLLVELAEALDELHDIKDSRERHKLLRMISATLSRLRTDDCREKLLDLKQSQLAARNKQITSSPAQSNPQKKFASLTHTP